MKKVYLHTRSGSPKSDAQFNEYTEYKATTTKEIGASVGQIYYHSAVTDNIISMVNKESKELAKKLSEYIKEI
jgi:hypothetical protein